MRNGLQGDVSGNIKVTGKGQRARVIKVQI
jgi:hypothetical protein